MIRKAKIEDLNKVVKLAQKLYGEPDFEVLKNEFKQFVEDDDCLILLAQIGGEMVGFAHIKIRHDYVEGCETYNVAYLEGIFVEEGFRKQGLAKEFVKFAISWAKEKGCCEFASDCPLTNAESIEFHKAIGFQEVNRIVCFKRKI